MTPLLIVTEMKKVLRNVDAWLTKAAAHAESHKFDPSVLMTYRLAPDMFPFSRQIQILCDTAKLSVSRITGREAPSHADTETTFAELSKRIGEVITYLEAFGADDFAGAAERSVSQPRWEGKTMAGLDYFVEHAIPNFFFHASMAYAILRHNGVPLGKRDFLGQLSLRG